MFETAALCLALNIYHEARNQSFEGQVAVAQVVMNRVESSQFPNTVCDVVKQAKTDKHGNLKRHKCQFSWYCDGQTDVPHNETVWKHTKILAKDFLDVKDELNDITNGALFYHSIKVKPYWSEIFDHTVKIDDHLFYTNS